MKETLYTLGDVVHTLQRERGCASIFLYSEGKLFRERMDAQFLGSDKAIQTLQEGVGRWEASKALKAESLQKLNQLLKLCFGLPEWRHQIEARTVSISDCISRYSHQLIGPMLQLMVEIALAMEKSNPTYVSAFNAFLHWKERIGLERAIGARGFVGYSFHNKEFVERVSFLLSEQDNYKNTYFALANEEQEKHVIHALKSSKIEKKLDRIHTALKESPDDGHLYDMTPESWFDLLSTKIDALHKAEKGLIDSLTKEESLAEENPPPSQTSPRSVFGDYENLIRSLQLFSGITIENLYTLLRNGQIRDFSKGKLLFLEGEPANRLYVVLKGWIKLFKGTAGGEETILQMLSGGDAILESAVFLNTSFPVSAQVVQDATLLSIPAPMLREQIKNNNELAQNLLATMSHRSQGLIRQIENTRLKSADERIGWFLLKLLLEQGRMSRCVDLPYDKSLIASYLDMKRETFSRALGRMKDKGFKIENNTVVIPELSALCGFCDAETAAGCASHGTPGCPNPGCDGVDTSAHFLENRAM